MALDKYDDDADQVAPGGRGGLGLLADGNDYDMEIESAELKETTSGHDIFKMKLVVIGGPSKVGKEIDYDEFLTTKDKKSGGITISEVKLGIVKKNLETLGFDSGEWTKANGRPFSKEIAKAILLLPGLRFTASKTTKDGYANLKIVARNFTADRKPEKFGPAELNKAQESDAEPFDC